MRILWFGKDSPHLTSAYAKINDELVCRRLRQYHECALFCTVGLSYGCFDVGDVTVYPGMGDMSGQNLFLDHYRDFKADLYITSYDIWPLDKLPQSAAKGEILWIPWAYVDYDPISPMVERLLPAVKVVPTSSWLERELQKAGLRNISEPIIPGVNQEVFKPIVGTKDEEEKEITKERLKKTLGFPPDCFLAGIFQMNQLYRKPFDIQMEGLQIFQKNNPHVKVRIWIHASPRVKHGWMLPELAKEHGFDHNRGDVKFADQYTLLKGLHGYNEDHMSRLLNSLDVLINCTTGDSPGMPVLEAQSCGTPVLTTNFCCFPEFTKAGYTVKVLNYFRPPHLPMLRKALPDPYDIADKLEKIYNSDTERWRKIGPEFISQFTWDNCLRGWLSVLSEVEEEIKRSCLRIPTPSETLKPLAQKIQILA